VLILRADMEVFEHIREPEFRSRWWKAACSILMNVPAELDGNSHCDRGVFVWSRRGDSLLWMTERACLGFVQGNGNSGRPQGSGMLSSCSPSFACTQLIP
jgi:hypothetical protein